MSKTNLAVYDNTGYQPGPVLKRAVWYFVNALFFKSSLFPFAGFKVFLLRLFGARIGKGVNIKPSVNIKYPWLLQLGDHCWIGENVWIDNLAMVEIGSHVCISQGALLLCGNHNFSSPSFELIVKPIVLQEGVWLGAKSIVCLGVICYSHAVLTAGSVATRHLEAYGIYQGNPCVKIKTREILN